MIPHLVVFAVLLYLYHIACLHSVSRLFKLWPPWYKQAPLFFGLFSCWIRISIADNVANHDLFDHLRPWTLSRSLHWTLHPAFLDCTTLNVEFSHQPLVYLTTFLQHLGTVFLSPLSSDSAASSYCIFVEILLLWVFYTCACTLWLPSLSPFTVLHILPQFPLTHSFWHSSNAYPNSHSAFILNFIFYYCLINYFTAPQNHPNNICISKMRPQLLRLSPALTPHAQTTKGSLPLPSLF